MLQRHHISAVVGGILDSTKQRGDKRNTIENMSLS